MASHLHSATNNKCSAGQATSTKQDRDAKFLEMLPQITREAGYHLPVEARADGVQEVVASAFLGYVRLMARDKSDVAYAGPLARYGAYQYFSGRRVGSRLNLGDVLSTHGRRKKGLSVERLDRVHDPTGDWEELVVEDRHSTPADVAVIRLDFAAWLESLPERTRCVAETLATGEATSHVARMFSLSASRVSQLRGELHQAWRVFQGEVRSSTPA